MSLNEAKSLLKEGGDVIKPVYEYWINKRKKLVRKCKNYLAYFLVTELKLTFMVTRKVTDMIIGNKSFSLKCRLRSTPWDVKV